MLFYIILFIKGIIIGIGKIIPGVSGAVLAISLGVYEEAILTFNNLLKSPKNNVKYLFSLGLGIILSVLLISGFIKFSLEKFYLTTMLFFVGLIVGGFPSFFKMVFNEKLNKKIILYILLFSFGSLFLFKNNQNNLVINNDFKGLSLMFLLGGIEAFTMIIPGISGTAIFILIGAYEHIIEMMSNLGNINYVINNINLFILYLLGLISGMIATIRLIKYLFEYHKKTTYYVISMFMISSTVLLMKQTLFQNYDILEIVVSLLFLLLGIKISNLLDHIGFNNQ